MRRFLDAMSGPARNKVVTAGATLLRERSTGAEPTATRGTDPESLARRDTRAPAPIPSIRRAAGPSTKVARSGDIETAEAGVEVGVEAGVEVEREDIDSINPCVVVVDMDSMHNRINSTPRFDYFTRIATLSISTLMLFLITQ